VNRSLLCESLASAGYRPELATEIVNIYWFAGAKIAAMDISDDDLWQPAEFLG
jgi:hypothetical protein